ncbi:hypothetical protein HanXRQr2_Chr04g0140331 [Helianthus annuus]|uniref:Uncharacterized protein n=1 Tax=Helianthus annuus TaxID=4232 RepID=A0A9K3NPH4_HELAN|nr:hypothetical protein HanXRQr2_Chr04g0140331 [Helianthus annuus]KAJ0929331.1 hypothetical protein HanPSC8_Chr04g0136401 [Helianthus annuus]
MMREVNVYVNQPPYYVYERGLACCMNDYCEGYDAMCNLYEWTTSVAYVKDTCSKYMLKLIDVCNHFRLG